MTKINLQPLDIGLLDNHEIPKNKKTTLTRSNTSKNGLRSVILKIAKLLSIFVAALLILVIAFAIYAANSDRARFPLPILFKASSFTASNLNQFPSQLKVQGNWLIDGQGNQVFLNGIMIADPLVADVKDDFNKRLFKQLHDLGANVIRIPVHPITWEGASDYLWRYLDKAVRWAGEYGMYVIIDWHSIGNVKTGSAPERSNMFTHTWENTTGFWNVVSAYFAGAPNVLFEVFNEPESITVSEWQAAASELVHIIRAQGAQQVVIVGGVDYASDLSWVLETPISDPNIAYAEHVYPIHSMADWTIHFGEVSKSYPVLITEWGFMEEYINSEYSYLIGNEKSFGEPFLDYLDELQIGWLACWYDDNWQPPMFTPGFEDTNPYGDFVFEQLSLP